jgi:DnaJ-class molecular chaperone
MPVVGKPTEHGDLYATVEAELPREISPEERQHYEALAKLVKGKKNSAA